MAESGNAPRKRQNVSTACSACQSKHRACGSERPCYQCVRLGLECAEGEPRRFTHRKRTTKDSTPSPSTSPPTSSSPPKKAPRKKSSTPTLFSIPPPLSTPPYLPSPYSTPSPPMYASPIYEDVLSISSSGTPSPLNYDISPTHNTYDLFDDTNLIQPSSSPLPLDPLYLLTPTVNTDMSFIETIIFDSSQSSNLPGDLLSNVLYTENPNLSTPPTEIESPNAIQLSPQHFPLAFEFPHFHSAQQFKTHDEEPGFAREFEAQAEDAQFASALGSQGYDVQDSSNCAQVMEFHTSSSQENLKDAVISNLQTEIAELRNQLLLSQRKRAMMNPEKPLLVSSIASAVWRLPEGIMLDSTKSLRELLKWHNKYLRHFDEITEPGHIEDMHSLRKSLVTQKAAINKIGFKTLLCGDGAIVTFMSCCLLIHFEDYAILQSTIWNTVY